MHTILKFLKNHGPYSPGDVAGFEDAAAQPYIAHGVAELATPSTVAEVAPISAESSDVGDTVQATAPAARRGRPPKS